MKRKAELFIAKILWWVIRGEWVDVADIQIKPPPDPLLRPIDQAIKQMFDLLEKWEQPQRKEIICAVINREWPGKHIHSNPKRRAA